MGPRLPTGETTYPNAMDDPRNQSTPLNGYVINDGYYSIQKTSLKVMQDGSTQTMFGHWLVGTDHSGNQGYMMVVNASYDTGIFYQTVIGGLCQGSTLYFSSYIANLIRAGSSDTLDPKLRFVIRSIQDSSIIHDTLINMNQRYSTLTWQQVGITFTPPSGQDSVRLQIYNYQKGGNGNDLCLDDISITLCGPDLSISSFPQFKYSQNICEGTPVTLSSTSIGTYYPNPEYQWQFSTDSLNWQDIQQQQTPTLPLPNPRAKDSGYYRLLVAEQGNINLQHCRLQSNELPLRVWPQQQVHITPNFKGGICSGDTLKLYPDVGAYFQWTGPNGFDTTGRVAEIPLIQPGQEGPYQLLDTTEGGCFSQASFVTSIQRNDLHLTPWHDTLLCAGRTWLLDASNPGATYLWNSGSTFPTQLVQRPGYYQVTVTKGVCVEQASTQVSYLSPPSLSLGPDTVLCMGLPDTLHVFDTTSDSYLWMDGSTDSLHVVDHSGVYEVTGKNFCGLGSATVSVMVEHCEDSLLFPNAFSPNNDGINDVFRPRITLLASNYDLTIYNRWGRLVFESKDPMRGWNGRHHGIAQPMDTYVWECRYQNSDHHSVMERGYLLLIR